LQCNLVRRHRWRAEQSHQISGGAEHAALKPHRQPDRSAKPEQLAEARPVGPPETAEQMETAELTVDQDDNG